MRSFLYLFLFIMCTSCGYRWGIQDNLRRVSVPYVEGDTRGLFTAALVRELTRRGVPIGEGGVIIKASLASCKDDNIGYILAPGEDFEHRVMVANEARIEVDVKVSLLECDSCQAVASPISVTARLDFDFGTDLDRIHFKDFHAFSLGQYEMYPLAKDVAVVSLYDKLAQKVVDVVISCL